MAKRWRRGITTGASAAAAARAAALLLLDGRWEKEIELVNPRGEVLRVPVARVERTEGGARGVVIKDGGDDPDVTHGLAIVADVFPVPAPGVEITGGRGVGRVTKPGLAVPPGEYAINPVPRQMITTALADLPSPAGGWKVVISVPGGEEVARRTLNPRLGIVGGISILGTTGIVEPMSEEAFKTSLVPQLDVVRAAGWKTVLLTPGRMGERVACDRYRVPPEAVALMSNFVGYMLEAAAEKGFERIILFGHHGKVGKVAGGIFHTHSRVADGRREVLAALAAARGAGKDLVTRILATNAAEEAVNLLREAGLLQVFTDMARRAARRAEEYLRGRARVGVVLTTLKGDIIGADEVALATGRELGWFGSDGEKVGL